MRLRFSVGDRVRCRTSATEWEPGRVVQLWYREDHWSAEQVVPYQVELDIGHLIYAPIDGDQVIRAEATFERQLYEEKSANEHTAKRHKEDLLSRYPRRHPALYEPAELPRFLDPALGRALQLGDDGTLQGLMTERSRGVYSLRFFTDEYCTMLLDECEHFERWCVAQGLPVHRPNTMNNHGAILDEFGMDAMMDAVMRRCVQPLSILAGYADVGGDDLRSHHAFVVEYALAKDRDLSFHVDSSDVTLNVCLGRDFEGGDLFFRGVRCRAHQQTGAPPSEEVTHSHTPGVAILHRGHHRHGAHKITSGERLNMILWCRGDPASSSEGANRFPRECQEWCWMHGDSDD